MGCLGRRGRGTRHARRGDQLAWLHERTLRHTRRPGDLLADQPAVMRIPADPGDRFTASRSPCVLSLEGGRLSAGRRSRGHSPSPSHSYSSRIQEIPVLLIRWTRRRPVELQ
ncbi:hypothetical protein FRAAL5474 [Frankia alni ACN14a]|uniref:Uncharacterized protein n=1 Tax=Frankia alni (strain DSM 45986 / CECT 9034 / ACN14a) TaxID=326424 RepID=Q0REK1_FRAAA|nr:hypothetical protein FRAAL5474 [Frankia alni ACN14a]